MRDVIIADKQDITYIGIRSIINQLGVGRSIHRVEDRAELFNLLASMPDPLVVIDYTLSDFTSADELLNVSYRFGNAYWLLFSEDLNDHILRQLLFSSGAFGVVLKSCDEDEINTALVHAFRGERFICSRVANQLLQVQKAAPEKTAQSLTATEKEILKEIALGKTTKEIAAERNLSFHTIITHRKNIFRKLDVNNVHEAIKYAMRAGIVDLAEYYI